MNKNGLTLGIIGLLAGLAIGFFGANSINRNSIKPATGGIQNPISPPMTSQPAGQPPAGGMLADVQKTLDRATNEPDNFQAQVDAGTMHARIQRFDKALEFFKKAQLLKPDDFQANSLLGNAYFDARQFENAETYYEKALKIKSDVTVQSDYATTFFQRSEPDYDRALVEFEKALKIDSAHEPTIYNMGVTYSRKGDKDNAQKTLEKLKEINSESSLIGRLEKIIATK